jgi:alkylation response protein AidB-like acyl-CoA dehydrogenase
MVRLDSEIMTRVERAAQLIAPMARTIEAERTLPRAAVEALVAAGVPKLFVPRDLGGAEAPVTTSLAAIEALARADGSAGWCAMITATSGLMSAFLPEPVAHEVYAAADAVTCGVFAPMGRAAREPGGYRVSGRWTFASACQHATHCMGSALVDTDGAPVVRSLLFRASELRIHETWDTSGLRGTGSHDIEVRDLFVPEERSFSLVADTPRLHGALYRQPFFGTLAAGVAAVSIGIARAAIDALVGLARDKTPGGARRTLAHRELVQLAVARAEAMMGASRAYLHDAVDRAAADVEANGAASLDTRATVRLAACHAAAECARAVDLAYEAGGASSIHASSPLQRCFRDVHVATQHVMVSATSATLAGRARLGLDVDLTML